MATVNNQWTEPKSDYVSTDQVRPEIFNTLATNEKHLKEISCQAIIKKTVNSVETETIANIIVLVEDQGEYKAYIKNSDDTLTEIPLIAENATKDGNSNNIANTYATKSGTDALTNKTYNGFTLKNACAKDIADSSSAEAIGTGTNLPTERDVYNGLPTINGSHTYTKDTNIYAPNSQLSASTEKRYLVGASSQTSMGTENTNANCYMQSGHLYSNGSKVVNNAMFVLNGTTLTITTT